MPRTHAKAEPRRRRMELPSRPAAGKSQPPKQKPKPAPAPPSRRLAEPEPVMFAAEPAAPANVTDFGNPDVVNLAAPQHQPHEAEAPAREQ